MPFSHPSDKRDVFGKRNQKMNVQGPLSADKSRFCQPRTQDTSSTANEAFLSAVNSASLPQPVGQTNPPVPQQADTVSIGSISLDLNFARSESLSTSASVKDANGSASVRQDLSRSFESELKIDFSFASNDPAVADKLAKLDPAILADWQKTAANVKSLNPKDYNEFVKATDGMFNEIEKALGMSSTGLDNVAGFFKDKVGGFINDVNKQMDYFNKNPLGSGPDLGLNIPGLFDSAKKTIPDDLSKYLDKTIKDMQSSNPESELLKRLKDIFKELIDKLTQPQTDPANPMAPQKGKAGGADPAVSKSPQTGGSAPVSQQQPHNVDTAQVTAQPDQGSKDKGDATGATNPQRMAEFSSRYASYEQRSVASSILLSYSQQAAPVPVADKSANTLALVA
jgi:hypothetical protein